MEDFPWPKLDWAKAHVSEAAGAKELVANGQMELTRRIEHVSFDK